MTVKEFLDAALSKYETWEESTAGENAIGKLFPDKIEQKRWVQLKKEGVGRETILKFLDAELAKYETWGEFCAVGNNRTNLGIDSGHAFSNLKGTGIGSETILKFLGSNWKEWMIRESLDTLRHSREGKWTE